MKPGPKSKYDQGLISANHYFEPAQLVLLRAASKTSGKSQSEVMRALVDLHLVDYIKRAKP